MENNLEISIRTKEKFEFYFLALVFTLLGLTIQTAKVSDNLVQMSFEYVGWLLFLISGISGLSRMEKIPVVFRYFHHQGEDKYLADELKKTRKVRHTVDSFSREPISQEDIEKTIEIKEKRVEKYQELIDDINQKTAAAYSIQKWGFMLGIFITMLSRAYYSYLDANKILIGN